MNVLIEILKDERGSIDTLEPKECNAKFKELLESSQDKLVVNLRPVCKIRKKISDIKKGL